MSDLLFDVGLYSDNFISKYIEYASRLTDAYIEWHFAGAMSILSIIADRKLVINLAHGNIYTNIWFLGLGDSTVARKSTGIRISEDIVSTLHLTDRKTPNAFSPESFIEHIADTPHTYFWKDECGQLLASLEKDYMRDIRDLFSDLYECKDYTRKLRTSQRVGAVTQFDVKEPYLTQWLMTTPESFREHTKKLDISSGWLVRYLYLYPEYPKTWVGFRIMDATDLAKREEILNILRPKMTYINTIPVTEMKLTQEAWTFFNDWQRQVEENALNNRDKIALAILGRLEVYSLKLAGLVEFGKPVFVPEITKETLEKTCKWVTDYFLPTTKKIVAEVEWDESKNLQEKILSTLKKNSGKMTRRDLMKKLHKSKSDVSEAIDALVESEEISMLKVGRSIDLKII